MTDTSYATFEHELALRVQLLEDIIMKTAGGKVTMSGENFKIFAFEVLKQAEKCAEAEPTAESNRKLIEGELRTFKILSAIFAD